MFLKEVNLSDKGSQESLKIDIAFFKPLHDCIHLIPDSILCGSTEVLPGLKGENLP